MDERSSIPAGVAADVMFSALTDRDPSVPGERSEWAFYIPPANMGGASSRIAECWQKHGNAEIAQGATAGRNNREDRGGEFYG